MHPSSPDPSATTPTLGDTLGQAIDGAAGVDALEEHEALAQVEARLFARARDPVRLSRYLLLRPLGAGGAGVVYDGYDPELARRVAVKVLRAGRDDPQVVARARARFIREARSIARLSHPNVIAVHDVGTYSAQSLSPGLAGLGAAEPEAAGVFIVMELVEGHDLSTWLERGPRSWREVLDVLVAAGQGLAAAHDAGIVHRDFKPGNVLVGHDGRVKVVDFGLALTCHEERAGTSGGTPAPSRLASAAEASVRAEGHEAALERLTRTGALLGTPSYMAPEQHRGEPADEKADQFAFCASLYRALHGQSAFSGRELDALHAEKEAGRVRPPAADRGVPAWVDRVVLRGLRADPALRYPSMHAVLEALRADPARRRVHWARAAAVPAAVLAVGYAAYVATRPGRVVVAVASKGRAVPGVRVVVDDQELPDGGGEVAAGLHRVRVTAPDHEPAEAVVDVQRGGVHEVAVELRHEQGTFELELEPAGGHVLVDGVDEGSRLRGLAVDTGRHELLLRHEGYVDERLEWTARAGQVERGFVALRRALAWSRPASGSLLEARWLGDVDGDGLDDLAQRRFNILTAYDPWNDRELWRVTLGDGSWLRLCDVDGDGVRDVVTRSADDDAPALVVYDGGADVRRPVPRWTVPAAGADGRGPSEVACVPPVDGAGGGARLVVAGLRAGHVVALEGLRGEVRWSEATGDDSPLAMAVGRDGEGVSQVVVLGRAGVRALGIEGGLRWSVPLAVAPRGAPEAEQAWAQRVAASPQRLLGTASLDAVAGDDLLVLVGDGEGSELVALGGHDGAERWRVGVGGPVDASRLAPVDADGDGAHDVLVARGGATPSLALHSGRSGQPLWTRAGGTAEDRVLALRPEPRVVTLEPTAAGGRDLVLLDVATGRPRARVGLEPRATSPVVGTDFDGDGRDDLVVGTSDGELRAFDADLRPLGAVPLRIPVVSIAAERDANHDGFLDLLLEARGPAVVVGPKVRWDRRPLDAVRATPVVADLDGDGALEVAVFGMLDDASRLEIMDARTGQVRASSRPEETAVVIRPPALVPTARGFDLVAVGSDGVRRYAGHDAALVGRWVTATAYASPTVADLDGDGEAEVVMVTWQDPGLVHALEGASLEPRWTYALGPLGAFGAPAVVDVDGDGTPEVVVASLDGRVVCLGSDGGLRWQAQTGGRLNFEPTVVDLDGDGTREILVTPHVPDDPLVVLEGDSGRERLRLVGVATRRARPEAIDVDGDGRPEVLVASATQGVVSLTGDGVVRWRYGFRDGDGLQPAASGSPLVADLDGDGGPEIVAGFEDGSLHVVDARSGAPRWRFRTGREEVEASPAAADVDGDGLLEVFVAGHDRHLFCLRHGPGAPR